MNLKANWPRTYAQNEHRNSSDAHVEFLLLITLGARGELSGRNFIRFLREDLSLAVGFVRLSEPAWLFLFADALAVINTVVGFWSEQVALCW